MGLLNCSHVVAVMTPNSAGSKWIPYEYGRVKSVAVASLQASIWLHRTSKVEDCGEYVYLGVVTKTENDIQDWLRANRGGCGLCRGPIWPTNIDEPQDLP
jgi:hypothetical protein